MTPPELAQACANAINSGRDVVILVVPGGPPRGERIRLDRKSRRKCPMGEVLDWQDNPPRTIAMFDAMDVLAWMAARGLVDVKTAEVRTNG